ncbi:MAG: LytTR family DNA-binding domain-containing protein [Lachnospiraceae bacterium]|nr:LytTR family DNA-binding domain-containing protein [Lachnospiraceae bacterium]
MWTVLILEDDIAQQNALHAMLAEEFPDMKILKAATYNEALDMIKRECIQLFLLDIRLKEKNPAHTGIALGKYIRSLPAHQFTPILFLTALADEISAAVNSIHCYNYLVKPFLREDFISAIRELSVSPMMQEHFIELTDINGVILHLKPAKLSYVTTKNKVLHLHMPDDIYRSRDCTLAKLAALLPKRFIRCHKSYIVNCDMVENYDKTARYLVLAATGTRIPVGKEFKPPLDLAFRQMQELTKK